MGLVLLQAPIEPVVTLEEAQAQVRSENPEEAAFLTSRIAAATGMAEAFCRRKFVSQKWRETFDRFPAGALRLHHPSLLSVESVKYVDGAGVLQTLASAAYVVRANEVPGEIVPAYSASWPGTRDEPDAVRVEFTSGYGAAADVPEAVKAAVLVIVGHLYAYRESTEMPQTAEWLLGPHRILRFAA